MRVDEGSSVNISCNSSGVPTPTVSWEMNDQLLPLVPIEMAIAPQPRLSVDILLDVMLGSILSTVEIVGARYPANDGVYICIGTNDEQTMNVSIATVQVQVVGKC